MLSTGNDIISLACIDIPRTKHTRFYGKVISPAELELYHASLVTHMPFEVFIWLAWSVKESAFKYLQRHQPNLVFSPPKINIQSINSSCSADIENFGPLPYEATSFDNEFASSGVVRNGSDVLHFRSVIHPDFLFTVVGAINSFRNILWGIKTIAFGDHQSQSGEVRAFLLQRLQAVFPHRRFSIGKNLAGCPVILSDAKELNIPVSLTHHHHFIAYSFLLEGSD